MDADRQGRFTVLSPEELLGPLNEGERKNAPERLYVAGDVRVLEAGPRVALVGSRKASRQGLANTDRLARFLVDHGVVVVSGLAEGIDTAAHETAIRLGGRTVAVLGTPLDQCYPARNRALQDRIMRDHLAVSQFSPGSRVERANFPLRNRTMALLAHGSVIVEAGDSSGSLHQGWEALRLGRPLFILESVAADPALTWPQEMAKYGATVLSLARVEEVLDVLPATGLRQALDVAP